MNKTITILFLLTACVITASAAPYAQSKIGKSTLFQSRTAINYGRYSLGVHRQTMDMSSRRIELRRTPDGRQEVKINYPSYYGRYDTQYVAPRQISSRRKSIYSITDNPGKVIGYRAPVVTINRGAADRYSDYSGEARSYHVVSSEISLGEVLDVPVYSGGSSSSGVYYGRTSNGESLIQTVEAVVGSIRPASFATTTADDPDADSQSNVQQFGETPSYDVPLGDAVFPLILLISLFSINKLRKIKL